MSQRWMIVSLCIAALFGAVACELGNPTTEYISPPGVHVQGTASGGSTNDGPDGIVDSGCSGSTWFASDTADTLTLSYGNGIDFPQVAVLDKMSGNIRFVYGRTGGWGAWIVLPPSFWIATDGGTSSCGAIPYCQGTRITVTPQIVCDKATLTFNGTIGGLDFTGTMKLGIPTDNEMSAQVDMTTSGTVALAGDRPGETFKIAMITTMHESDAAWIERFAVIENVVYPFTADQWIATPPVTATQIGVIGGIPPTTPNITTPTISLGLTTGSQPIVGTGWVTPSPKPNDNNASVWLATPDVRSSWGYSISVTNPATADQ